ncbi:MAG: hypothetical protein K2K32_08070, partial [Muribaculaceae bacterium]|nr:hypothetical protein [Muribaculaceae bacterium]
LIHLLYMVTKMLEKAIEIEGLLRIIRDGNPGPEVFKLIKEKSAELADEINRLENAEETPEEKKEEISNEQIEMGTMTEESAEAPLQEHLEKYVEEPAEELKEESEEDESFVISEKVATEEPKKESEEEASEESGEEPLEELIKESEEESFEESEEESMEGIKNSDGENNDADDDDIMLTFDVEEPETESKDPEIDMTREVSVHVANQATGFKRQTKLKSSFSLNDRFLYSRELFNGNMKMFDSTLEFIEGIEDFPIIEDYFYNELEWDPENLHVATFMEILRPNFRE